MDKDPELKSKGICPQQKAFPKPITLKILNSEKLN